MPTSTTTAPRFATLILCGGEGRRLAALGKNKALLEYRGRPLIDWALSRQSDHATQQLLSCGPKDLLADDLDRYLNQHASQVQRVFDEQNQRQGPLAGIASGLRFALQNLKGLEYIISSPVDTPQQPIDLAQRLLAHANPSQNKIISSCCQMRIQPLHSLWPVACLDALDSYLASKERRVMGFLEAYGYQTVAFENADLFHNINHQADLIRP